MSSVDAGALVDGVTEILLQLDTAQPDLVTATLKNVQEVDKLRGSADVEILKSSAADANVLGMAPDMVPPVGDTEFGTFDYSIEMFGHREKISKSQAQAMSQSIDGENVLLRKIRNTVNYRKVKTLVGVLGNTNFASSTNLTTPWDNEDADPTGNIQEMMRNLGQFNTIYLGERTFDNLLVNPQFKEKVSYYSGGGATTVDGLKMYLSQISKGRVNVADIHVIKMYANSANATDAFAKELAAEDLFWCGMNDNLVLVNQRGQERDVFYEGVWGNMTLGYKELMAITGIKDVARAHFFTGLHS